MSRHACDPGATGLIYGKLKTGLDLELESGTRGGRAGKVDCGGVFLSGRKVLPVRIVLIRQKAILVDAVLCERVHAAGHGFVVAMLLAALATLAAAPVAAA